MLTPDERRVIELAGQLYTFVANHIVAHGPTREDDLRELRGYIHGFQRAIQAQAAGRAHPRQFRLLGGELPEWMR